MFTQVYSLKVPQVSLFVFFYLLLLIFWDSIEISAVSYSDSESFHELIVVYIVLLPFLAYIHSHFLQYLWYALVCYWLVDVYKVIAVQVNRRLAQNFLDHILTDVMETTQFQGLEQHFVHHPVNETFFHHSLLFRCWCKEKGGTRCSLWHLY